MAVDAAMTTLAALVLWVVEVTGGFKGSLQRLGE
jgi:hypothetical protein